MMRPLLLLLLLFLGLALAIPASWTEPFHFGVEATARKRAEALHAHRELPRPKLTEQRIDEMLERLKKQREDFQIIHEFLEKSSPRRPYFSDWLEQESSPRTRQHPILELRKRNLTKLPGLWHRFLLNSTDVMRVCPLPIDNRTCPLLPWLNVTHWGDNFTFAHPIGRSAGNIATLWIPGIDIVFLGGGNTLTNANITFRDIIRQKKMDEDIPLPAEEDEERCPLNYSFPDSEVIPWVDTQRELWRVFVRRGYSTNPLSQAFFSNGSVTWCRDEFTEDEE
jgi:hypothetical protein